MSAITWTGVGALQGGIGGTSGESGSCRRKTGVELGKLHDRPLGGLGGTEHDPVLPHDHHFAVEAFRGVVGQQAAGSDGEKEGGSEDGDTTGASQ